MHSRSKQARKQVYVPDALLPLYKHVGREERQSGWSFNLCTSRPAEISYPNAENEERKDILVVKTLDYDSGGQHSIPGCDTDSLCALLSLPQFPVCKMGVLLFLPPMSYLACLDGKLVKVGSVSSCVYIYTVTIT